MKPDIPSPALAGSHPDIGLECEFCLEQAFQALAKRAAGAGWPEEVVATALVNLACAHVAALCENRLTDAQIAAALN